MRDEPRRHPLFMISIALCALGTAPFLFIGSEPTTLLGLPTWLWSSVLFTLALSVLTAWGLLKYWPDEPDSDPARPGSTDEKP